MEVTFEYSDRCNELKCFSPNLIEQNTKSIIKYFPELKDIKVLLYFNHRPNDYRNWRHGISTTFPLDYPDSCIKLEFPYLAIKIEKYSKIDFVIHFSKLVIEGEEIRRHLEISHEFQHVSQYHRNKTIYLYSCILRYLLGDKAIPEEKIPTEYDATRKSKIVTYSIYRKEEIDRYIQKMLSYPGMPKYPFAILYSINTEEDYNLEKEVLELWKLYKIEEKIENLKGSSNITPNQQRIIEMYDFANT